MIIKDNRARFASLGNSSGDRLPCIILLGKTFPGHPIAKKKPFHLQWFAFNDYFVNDC